MVGRSRLARDQIFTVAFVFCVVEVPLFLGENPINACKGNPSDSVANNDPSTISQMFPITVNKTQKLKIPGKLLMKYSRNRN